MTPIDQYRRLAREALDELATTVHNLSPGDIGSTDRVLRPIDQTLAALTAAAVELVEQEKRQALLDAAEILSGIGSRGDKVNGHPKFLMGVETAEEVLTGYAEDLPLLAENAAMRRQSQRKQVEGGSDADNS